MQNVYLEFVIQEFFFYFQKCNVMFSFIKGVNQNQTCPHFLCNMMFFFIF